MTAGSHANCHKTEKRTKKTEEEAEETQIVQSINKDGLFPSAVSTTLRKNS